MGPTEFEEKAIIFCENSKLEFSDESIIKDIYNSLLIVSKEDEYKEILTNVKNQFYEQIKNKISNTDLNPLFNFLLINENNFSKIEKLKFDYLFNKIIIKEKNQLIIDFINSTNLNDKRDSVLKNFKLLEENVYSNYFQNNKKIYNDYFEMRLEQPKSDDIVELEYFKIHKKLTEIIKSIDYNISKWSIKINKNMISQFDKVLENSIFPSLFDAFYSSDSNKYIQFLDLDQNVYLNRIYDVLLSLNKISKIDSNDQKYLMMVFKPDTYINPVHKTLRVIRI